MRFIVLIFVMLLSTAAAWAQEPHCPSLTWRDLADHSEIWVENPYDVMTALSFEFIELTNVTPDKKEPMVIKVGPHQKFKLITLTPIDRSQKYRYNWKCHWMWGDLDARPNPDAVYRLPFASGTSHMVLQGFNGEFTHKGELAYAVDFDMAEGTAVLAARDGTVVLTEDRFTKGGVDKAYWTTANYVMVRHDDGTIATYEHLSHDGVKVKVGQAVKAGDLLGYSGNTGYTAMPHLHFMVYRAKDGYGRESYPMKFKIVGQPVPVEPLEGLRYTAP